MSIEREEGVARSRPFPAATDFDDASLDDEELSEDFESELLSESESESDLESEWELESELDELSSARDGNSFICDGGKDMNLERSRIFGREEEL